MSVTVPRWHVRGAVLTGALVVAALAACSSAGGSATRDAASGGSARVAGQLSLPRIPWEGGPSYWAQFPVAKRAGWADPGFFPVVAWFDSISSDDEVRYDKSVGINTYVGGDTATPYRLFGDNGVFWIGERLKDTPAQGADNWVGYFLDDEVDGRFGAEKGLPMLRAMKAKRPEGRFGYVNYTTLVLTRDMSDRDAEGFVNDYSDVVSSDMYWYTTPFCDNTPFYNPFIIPIRQPKCRSASSYGRQTEMLRRRDAGDGKLQPLWQFVEIVGGGPAGGPFVALIQPGQLRGAVMSSLIHEARGVAYFNQALFGPCTGGNLIRMSQMDPKFCGAAQVEAVKQMNAQIRSLARVLNTQSYRWTFGPGLDTMLKTYDGNAYVFAMIDDTGSPGKRTFTLPDGVDGRVAEVVDEGRTVPIKGGTFEDAFAAERSYHVYRIPLAAT